MEIPKKHHSILQDYYSTTDICAHSTVNGKLENTIEFAIKIGIFSRAFFKDFPVRGHFLKRDLSVR
jgi:hypothetical protein